MKLLLDQQANLPNESTSTSCNKKKTQQTLTLVNTINFSIIIT